MPRNILNLHSTRLREARHNISEHLVGKRQVLSKHTLEIAPFTSVGRKRMKSLDKEAFITILLTP